MEHCASIVQALCTTLDNARMSIQWCRFLMLTRNQAGQAVNNGCLCVKLLRCVAVVVTSELHHSKRGTTADCLRLPTWPASSIKLWFLQVWRCGVPAPTLLYMSVRVTSCPLKPALCPRGCYCGCPPGSGAVPDATVYTYSVVTYSAVH